MDSRGLSTVVEKTLAIGLTVLFVSLVSVTVYGGVVPDFRAAAGDRIADRTIASAAERIQQAIPPNVTDAEVRVRVTLPDTIQGAAYDIRPDNRTLRLEHPREHVQASAGLGLPETVRRVEGRWESGEQTVVSVRRVGDGLVVRLTAEGR